MSKNRQIKIPCRVQAKAHTTTLTLSEEWQAVDGHRRRRVIISSDAVSIELPRL